MSTLSAQTVALEAIVALRPLLTKISRMDRDLDDQIRRAANSTHLNLAEGLGSLGAIAARGFTPRSAVRGRSAPGSSVAWGHLEPEAVLPVEVLLDRVCAMLWRLARGRG